jgi:hypothetical protein
LSHVGLRLSTRFLGDVKGTIEKTDIAGDVGCLSVRPVRRKEVGHLIEIPLIQRTTVEIPSPELGTHDEVP